MTIDRFDAESTPSERSAGLQRMRTCFRSALSENNEYVEAYSEKAPAVPAVSAPRPKAGDGFPLDEWLRQSEPSGTYDRGWALVHVCISKPRFLEFVKIFRD